jgi:hypothetical protein
MNGWGTPTPLQGLGSLTSHSTAARTPSAWSRLRGYWSLESSIFQILSEFALFVQHGILHILGNILQIRTTLYQLY